MIGSIPPDSTSGCKKGLTQVRGAKGSSGAQPPAAGFEAVLVALLGMPATSAPAASVPATSAPAASADPSSPSSPALPPGLVAAPALSAHAGNGDCCGADTEPPVAPLKLAGAVGLGLASDQEATPAVAGLNKEVGVTEALNRGPKTDRLAVPAGDKGSRPQVGAGEEPVPTANGTGAGAATTPQSSARPRAAMTPASGERWLATDRGTETANSLKAGDRLQPTTAAPSPAVGVTNDNDGSGQSARPEGPGMGPTAGPPTHSLASPFGAPAVTSADYTAASDRPVPPSGVTPAIADAARHLRQRPDGSWRMVIRLDPPELGSVRVDLVAHGDSVHLVLKADTAGAHAALASRHEGIEHALRGEGFSLGSFDVFGGERDSQGSRQPHHRRAADRAFSDGTAADADPEPHDDSLRL